MPPTYSCGGKEISSRFHEQRPGIASSASAINIPGKSLLDGMRTGRGGAVGMLSLPEQCDPRHGSMGTEFLTGNIAEGSIAGGSIAGGRRP